MIAIIWTDIVDRFSFVLFCFVSPFSSILFLYNQLWPTLTDFIFIPRKLFPNHVCEEKEANLINFVRIEKNEQETKEDCGNHRQLHCSFMECCNFPIWNVFNNWTIENKTVFVAQSNCPQKFGQFLWWHETTHMAW